MTASLSTFFALLTLVADAITIGVVAILIWSRFSERGVEMLKRLKLSIGADGLFLAWAIAVVATLGSLYYSEVANFTPCKLCWFQRIAMYPQAVLLGVATFRRESMIRLYALPIVILGALISVYHYLIERFPSWASSTSCDPTAPCTTVWVWKFHFISIPFMAFSGFVAIAALLLLLPKSNLSEGSRA